MEDLSRAQAQCKEMLRDIKKRKRTLQQHELRKTKYTLSSSVRALLCNLILMHVPWTAIAVILWVAIKKNKKQKEYGFKPEELQKVAEDTIHKNPNLVLQASDMNNLLTIRAKAWKHEFDLALWLLIQSKKGISVPPRLAVHQYLSYWGMGPQPEQVTKHLKTFETHQAWKHWMSRYRTKWGFDHAICPKGSALDTDQMKEKVAWK